MKRKTKYRLLFLVILSLVLLFFFLKYKSENFGLLILIAGLAVVGISFFWWMVYARPVNIKDKRAGNGQHGKSHWMDDAEKDKIFHTIQKGKEHLHGFALGFSGNEWLVDTSEDNVLLLAPPKAGKTTKILIPSILYNAAIQKNTKNGASMLILDCKGELFRRCAGQLKAAGYRISTLDLRNILKSNRYNFITHVNRAMGEYREAKSEMERAIAYGKAERCAKQAAGQLIGMGGAEVKSEASDYFNETARGLLTGIILLVSQYAAPEERHIISVFNLILEMNGQILNQQPNGQAQKTKLQELLEHIGNQRIMFYTGAATSADSRTSMNVFSSALGKLAKFIDAELEQILCGHDDDFDGRSFIEQPTAIFFISPDENTTRHFMSSLAVRNILNETIEIAEKEYEGVLPRKVQIYLDEFGQQPPIEDFDALCAAYRSRGGRFISAIQDFAQLQKHYSKDKANIIKGTNQTLITAFVAPSALETAEAISKILGNETILTGSSSQTGNKVSTTSSLIGRPLMAASDLISMPLGDFIVIKGGCSPCKISPPGYWTHLEQLPEPERNNLAYQRPMIADAESIRLRITYRNSKLVKGMFHQKPECTG
ncbi:MAG TPA: type IV secretory system conjugative DNA transfer family protein [Candidatus Ruthenibacterium merdavium]|uniref:Type IV secretory system conjugative DNA transfer family protein n=1 Tax=Candidatus Ruthenibacterium merdavium TaxID=2838752 RepID=A0A9D2Q512_9FIRM|nr:type IV secretory system conjugative DNA transfer family protein [Candidatus Ruthenibacterium merdavium]